MVSIVGMLLRHTLIPNSIWSFPSWLSLEYLIFPRGPFCPLKVTPTEFHELGRIHETLMIDPALKRVKDNRLPFAQSFQDPIQTSIWYFPSNPYAVRSALGVKTRILLIDTDWLSLLLMRSFTECMNDLLRPPTPPRTDAKKIVSESILSINVLLLKEKIVFLWIKFCKYYLLILFLVKSGQ